MNHLLDISQLSYQDLTRLIERARHFKQNPEHPQYPHIALANLFYENSTRTRVSFELAAKALGMPVINLDLERSSESKGETINDTLNTLHAMGISLFVVRHTQTRMPHDLADRCGKGMHIINAGDGEHAHPSQALLDFMTLIEHAPDIKSLKIVIVGDLRHSRVANSLQCMAATFGVKELALVSPVMWQPKVVHYGYLTSSFEDGLKQADVVICLRVQQERLKASEQLDLATYRQDYALTRERLALAKPHAMVMHPGPINRGVEIDSDVADGSQSFILQQVKNGVYMRMAILEALACSVR